MIISTDILETEMFQIRENQNTHFIFNNPLLKIVPFEIMWKNTQNALLSFYCNSGSVKALQYYAVRTLPVWISLDLVCVSGETPPPMHPLTILLDGSQSQSGRFGREMYLQPLSVMEQQFLGFRP